MHVVKYWNRVRVLLRSQGITQEAFAKKCHIPLGTLKGWMAKNYWPPFDDAGRIARHLGVSLDYLFYGKEPDIGRQIEKLQILIKRMEKSMMRLQK